MTRRRPRAPAAALLVLLLALGGLVPAAADPDDAMARVEEADAAMEAGSWAAAEALYRRALEAMETCLPARHGLGEALLAQERTDEAIVAFRRVLRTAHGGADVPATWTPFVRKAAKRLEELDETGQALEALVDEHVARLVRLAAKYRHKDPDLADRALDAVLAQRPRHERARELRGVMSDQGVRREAAFDGKQIDDWDGGRSDWWRVDDGVIVAETAGIASFIRTQSLVEGNFDVRMEARITKVYDKSPFIALMGAWKAEYDHSRFGVLVDGLTWFEKRGEDDSEQVYRCDIDRLRKPIEASAWNTYELRYRDGKIAAAINGRVVHEIDRPAHRDGGFVGILAQGCRAEIRSVEILYR